MPSGPRLKNLKPEHFAICRVKRGLRRSWPRNLSVKRLEIVGSLGARDIQHLGSIQCKLELEMYCVSAEKMYQLLERHIGWLVKSLLISDMYHWVDNIKFKRSEINLERMLAACPNLEHFKLLTLLQEVVLHDNYHMQPALLSKTTKGILHPQCNDISFDTKHKK